MDTFYTKTVELNDGDYALVFRNRGHEEMVDLEAYETGNPENLMVESSPAEELGTVVSFIFHEDVRYLLLSLREAFWHEVSRMRRAGEIS